MRVGKNYIVHCGDWHTFVGRCNELVGSLVYEMVEVSKIDDTRQGDNWHDLAANKGNARRQASYLHYDTPMCVPLSIAAFEWVGELPARS